MSHSAPPAFQPVRYCACSYAASTEQLLSQSFRSHFPNHANTSFRRGKRAVVNGLQRSISRVRGGLLRVKWLTLLVNNISEECSAVKFCQNCRIFNCIFCAAMSHACVVSLFILCIIIIIILILLHCNFDSVMLPLGVIIKTKSGNQLLRSIISDGWMLPCFITVTTYFLVRELRGLWPLNPQQKYDIYSHDYISAKLLPRGIL